MLQTSPTLNPFSALKRPIEDRAGELALNFNCIVELS